MFNVLQTIDDAEATAAIHYAVTRITHRAYWAQKTSAEPSGEYGERIGLRLVQEIEAAEGKALADLPDARADHYRRMLLDRAEGLGRDADLSQRDAKRLLNEIRAIRVEGLSADILTMHVGTGGSVYAAAYVALVMAGSVALGIAAWPTSLYGPRAPMFRLFSPELQLLICTAAFGALGSAIRTARLLAQHVGSRARHMVWWYVWRAPAGAVTGVLFYMMLRGFFLAPDVPAEKLNIFGIVSMSALAGMFTDDLLAAWVRATDRLFRPADE
jgi:hypothetical protein